MEYVLPKPQSILRLSPNRLGRDFLLGDVQGELQLLEELLKVVRFNRDSDRILSVGDLVDRGPNSREVMTMAASAPWLHSVLGNHEVMAAECLLGRRDADPLSDQAWTASLPRNEIQAALTFLLSRPIAIEVEIAGLNVGIVHAEVPLGSSWAELESRTFDWADANPEATDRLVASLLWGRRRLKRLTHSLRVEGLMESVADKEKPAPVPGIDLVVAGHTVLRLNGLRPAHIRGHLWIDTGAGYQDGRLTIVDFAARSYVQLAKNSKPTVTPLPAMAE